MKVLGIYNLNLGGEDVKLSFSINMLRAFKELHGMSLQKKATEVDALRETDIEDYHFEHGMLVCDIVFCAMYAYAEEEGFQLNATRSKVVKLVTELDDDEKKKLIAFMHHNNSAPSSLGKKKAAQKKEKTRNL